MKIEDCFGSALTTTPHGVVRIAIPVPENRAVATEDGSPPKKKSREEASSVFTRRTSDRLCRDHAVERALSRSSRDDEAVLERSISLSLVTSAATSNCMSPA